MKIALLTVDNRENERRYDLEGPYFGTAPAALLEGFADLPDLTLHVISCSQKPLSSPEKLAPNIYFHSLHVPKLGWLRTGYFGCIRAVRKKLLELQPDLIHAQGTERDCAMSAVFSPFPKVLTLHGNLRLIERTIGFRFFSACWLQARLEAFVIPFFQGVVCITKYTQAAVRREAQKTWLVPNAVEKMFFTDASSRKSRQFLDPPSILVVANVNIRKNQIALVESLFNLAKKRRFQLRFFGKCGDDPYGRRFLNLIRNFSWCYWGGMVDRRALKAEFNQARALFLPTKEDNCPMVVLEAQASGIPVIASNVGGVPDLVEDGITGLLIDPSNESTMAAALEKILSDDPLVEILAMNGYRQACAKFHPSIIARRHQEIYREVIASR